MCHTSYVLAVLLYGAETWKMTEHDGCRLDRFQRGCLRRIFRIFWPEKITNKDLYKKAEMIPVSDMIADRRWRWLGHVLRLESINHAEVSLTWSPEGRRRRGRPKTTWCRMVESEWRRLGFNSWTQIEQVVKDRAKWKELTYGLTHPPLRCNEDDDDGVPHIGRSKIYSLTIQLHHVEISAKCRNV